MEERLTGTVAWFNDAKGFGFIRRDDGGDDVFVHYSQIRHAAGEQNRRTLAENEPVSFAVKIEPKGPMAVDVERGAA